jgi:hypothetical protein
VRDTAAVRRVVLPDEEWRELGRRRRREVARHARQRRQHPDPYVAAVARAWAAQQVPDEPGGAARRVRSALTWTGGTMLLGLVAAVLGDAAEVLLPGQSVWRERRLARRILHAAGQ